jgi:uncharacterized membrane protein
MQEQEKKEECSGNTIRIEVQRPEWGRPGSARLAGHARTPLITLQDAAIFRWPQDRKKPQTRQLSSMAGTGATWGAFWGMHFGLIFFVPLLGMAIGAGMGALRGSLANVGIDDEFIRQVREKVTSGTSALFALSSGATEDRVIEELR